MCNVQTAKAFWVGSVHFRIEKDWI